MSNQDEQIMAAVGVLRAALTIAEQGAKLYALAGSMIEETIKALEAEASDENPRES